MRGLTAKVAFSAQMEARREELREFLQERSLLWGDFTLSNGQKSKHYFDCKMVTLSSRGADLIADAFLAVLASLPEKPDAIGGLTMGADPIVCAVQMRALQHGIRYEGFYARQEAKKHGTMKYIENPPPPGSKVVIVDDVVTTGKSVILAIERAVDAGCNVTAVITLVDREQGGGDKIRNMVPAYYPIFSAKDLPKLTELVRQS